MNTDFTKGIMPPILIPIDKDEKIDEAKLRKQVGLNGYRRNHVSQYCFS